MDVGLQAFALAPDDERDLGVGLEVDEAIDDLGARALELFRARQSEIELAILDVVMPELDGWQAFLEMEKLQPGLKVLFTTGYAASVLPEDFAARGARLLTKPYKPERLVAHVRELLRSAQLG